MRPLSGTPDFKHGEKTKEGRRKARLNLSFGFSELFVHASRSVLMAGKNMKNPLDPRHKKRQKIVEDLFKNSFLKQNLGQDTKEIIIHLEKIDNHIKKAAPEFPIEKINRVDLSILRLAVFELMIEKRQPPKVIVDEAIELAKEYGGEKTPSFVNGALGKIVNNLK